MPRKYQDLFSDDRVLKRADEYWANILDEVHYIIRVVPMSCFARVLNTLRIAMDVDDFRDLVLRSLHASLGYLQMSVFDQLSRYPLRMCQGDITRNIDILAAIDRQEAEQLDVLIRKCGG